MNKVVKLLSSLGEGKQLEDLEISLDGELQEALKERNVAYFESLLDVKSDIICFIAPAEDEEEDESETPDEKEEEVTKNLDYQVI